MIYLIGTPHKIDQYGFKKEYLNIFDSFIPPDQHKHHDDHHLGDVEDDGEEKGGQDVDGQVDGGGVAPLQIADLLMDAN